MPTAHSRRNRLKGELAVLLKARLRPSTKAELEQAAGASGLSLGLYFEHLTRQLRQEHDGQLPVFADALDIEEEYLNSA